MKNRLSGARRPLAVLLAVLLVASSVPVPVGADFTTEEWRTTFDGVTSDHIRDVAYAENKVFVTITNGELVALDAGDGSEIWNVSAGATAQTGMAVLPSENAVYVTPSGSNTITKYDMDTGKKLATNSDNERQYDVLATNRNDGRLYGGAEDESGTFDSDVVHELSTSDMSPTGRSVDIGNTPDLLAVDQNEGYVQVDVNQVGIKTFNAELTEEIDNDEADVYPNSNVDSTNSTSYWLGDNDGNLTEHRKSDDSQVDTVEIFSNQGVSAVGVAGDRDEVVVFAGSGGGTSDPATVVRYNTDTLAVDGEESLDLDVRRFMEHSETQEYEVTADIFNESTGEIETVDATEHANVTSGNTSALTVINNTDELVATSNTDVNREVTVTATYKGISTEENVTVAEVTVDNLEILPPWARLEATMQPGTSDNPDDHTFMIIVIATFTAIAGARLFTTYVGIGGYTSVFIAGWLIGMTTTGMLLVVLTVVGFVTLNLAANIDYGFDQ